MCRIPDKNKAFYEMLGYTCEELGGGKEKRKKPEQEPAKETKTAAKG